MTIKQAAQKEMKRMKEIFERIKVKKNRKAVEFYDFALNYYKDGFYFFDKKQFIESFEAFVIAWAYLDAGMKLKFFKVPKKQKKYFTV
jgi:hypothetical protein